MEYTNLIDNSFEEKLRGEETRLTHGFHVKKMLFCVILFLYFAIGITSKPFMVDKMKNSLEDHDMPPPNPGVSAENLKVYWDKKRDSVNAPLMIKPDKSADDAPDLSNNEIGMKGKLSPASNLKYEEDVEININII